ncbi:MAG: methyltransferase family protein [Candidatus Rokuibacteriota bacterium]
MTGARGAAVPDMLRVGDFLFRWRSYLPLLLVPVAVLGIVRARYLFASHAADLVWEFACLSLALAGLALRVWTVGVAARGTSGRNTRQQKAASLNTTGPYSIVRHPLYVANGMIVVSLALFMHGWIAPIAVTVLTIVYYACIAWREEQFLRERFGPAFGEWAAQVPAVVPVHPGRYVRPARPFQWKVAVRREFYAATLILVAPFFVDMAEDFQETGQLVFDPVWVATATLGVLLFVVLRYLKKHTSVLTVA